MLILIIGLIILAGIAMTVGVLHNRQIQKKIESGELKAAPEIVEADAECCGQHEICEKESLLAAVSKKIEYYDDENWTAFAAVPQMVIMKKKWKNFGKSCTLVKKMK